METSTSTADGPLHYAVIIASVRKERLGRAIADWVADRVPDTTQLHVIDLAEVQLPDDEFLQPGGGPQSEIADRIDAADGFVIVTPEYNHSYPASLKRAIDWHYGQWQRKAATVVSYGAQGGFLATEHLRGVFAELHVVTTRRVVGLRSPWNDVDEVGYIADDATVAAMEGALAELDWWAATLREARSTRPFPA